MLEIEQKKIGTPKVKRLRLYIIIIIDIFHVFYGTHYTKRNRFILQYVLFFIYIPQSWLLKSGFYLESLGGFRKSNRRFKS
jgi:hypothetical protein